MVWTSGANLPRRPAQLTPAGAKAETDLCEREREVEALAMIVTSLVMAAMIAVGLYAFFGLQRQERERLALRNDSVGANGSASSPGEDGPPTP